MQSLGLAVCCGLFAVAGCGDDDTSTDPGTGSGGSGTAFTPPENLEEAIGTYSRIVLASYEDSIAAAEEMDSALQAFVAAPSEQTHEAAKQAWLDAREPYLQTEVYRFYDGPIDNPEDGPEGLLNAWPMDENYVDYVREEPMAGIINDPEGVPDLTGAVLEGLNEQGAEENVATGYHPIEFLLWGQDFNEDGPGERPHTDFVTDGGTASNQARRAEYLTVTSELLLQHLRQVRDEWTEDGDYRTAFEAADPLESFQKVLAGMIILSGFETAGERLQVALDSGDQEDEHSCFSDNTHRDMIQDAVGIQNVYLGSYERLDGTTVSGVGLYDVVAEVDQDLADQLRDEIAATIAAAEALPVPFDQAIAPGNTEGNERVRDLIAAFRAQEMTMFVVFDRFGLTVEIPTE